MLLRSFCIFIFIIISGACVVSHANDKTATSILLFGDSIIAGYGLAEQDSLSVQLEAILRSKGSIAKVINGGVSGDTTTSGRSRIEWTINKHKPDIVLIALGGNDVLRGFSPEITRQNIDFMLKALKDAKVRVILSSVQAPLNLGVDYKKSFDSIYPEMAKKYNVPLYPFLLEKIFGKAEFMQDDQIHPNANGIKTIAKELGDYIIDAVGNVKLAN